MTSGATDAGASSGVSQPPTHSPEHKPGRVTLYPVDGGTADEEVVVLMTEDYGWAIVEPGDGREVKP